MAPKERIKVNTVRTLGAEHAPARPMHAPPASVTPGRALETLKSEFERVLAMKDKLAAESKVGSGEKGRAVAGADDKLRCLIASLEGMSRFGLQLGLITPADNRALFADAMKRGLYDGLKR